MRITLAVAFGSLLLASCSSLTVQNVNYGWPVEAVATVSQANMVTADRYGLSFSVAKIAEREFQDTSALVGSQLRILRSNEGFYFVTGPRFKNVYVFHPGTEELQKESVIEVSPTGLRNPALNLRPPHVELIDGEGFRRLLTRSDIVEEKNQ